MSLGRGKVDQATLGRGRTGACRPGRTPATSRRTSRTRSAHDAHAAPASSSSASKWPLLASIAPSCIRAKCSSRKMFRLPVAVTKTSPQAAASSERHDQVAVHQRLDRADRIDLDHRRPARPCRAFASAMPRPDPAIAGDHDLAPGEQDVGRAQDAVDGRLPGAVAVVEEVLGLRLVDRHDRVAQRSVGGHGAQSDDASGCLLGTGDHVVQLARRAAGGAARRGRSRRPSSAADGCRQRR